MAPVSLTVLVLLSVTLSRCDSMVPLWLLESLPDSKLLDGLPEFPFELPGVAGEPLSSSVSAGLGGSSGSTGAGVGGVTGGVTGGVVGGGAGGGVGWPFSSVRSSPGEALSAPAIAAGTPPVLLRTGTVSAMPNGARIAAVVAAAR
jgi:hypothetical protein